MATKYEFYSPAPANTWGTAYGYGPRWRAQTFTPSISHRIASVRLLMRRSVGEGPGTVLVSIKVTDGSGHPTGGDLCSGTTDGNTLSTATLGAWREITLGAGATLTTGTKYAIVIRAPDATDPHQVWWNIDTTSPTYAGGNAEISNDAGGSWASTNNDDHLFEEWGLGLVVTTQPCTDTIAEKTTGHGTITEKGLSPVTQHGHCWATTPNPTTADSKTENGAAPNLGPFQSAITGLSAGQTYYVRGYATDSSGTAYGSDVTITTPTTIGRRYWWVERGDFHFFSESGTEKKLKGVRVAGDSDLLSHLMR